ncbi:MAG: hypothetical protein J7L88_05190 [Thermoplasmata archaeon]|nr:hypothetical protein [Thermoplasmata archaeon]
MKLTYLFWMAAYFAVLLYITHLSRVRRGGRIGFYLASRKLSSFQAASTIGATTIGGSATVVTAALVLNYGAKGIVADIGGALGLIALGLFLAGRVRRSSAHSLPHLISMIYGEEVGRLSALLLFVTEVGWVALLFKATQGIFISIDFYPFWAILFTALFLTLYTAVGGQRTVALTDIFQIFLLLGVFLFMVGAAVVDPIPLQSTEIMPQGLLLTLFFMMFLSHMLGPDIYSKVLSTRDSRTAERGSIIGGVIKLLVGVMLLILVLSVGGVGINDSSTTLETIGIYLMPGFLSGLLLATLLSIMMSSADSCLLTGATIMEWDILKKDLKGWQRTLLIFTIGLLALFLACSASTILDVLIFSYGIFTSSLSMPLLLALLFPKAEFKKVDGALSMMSGLVTFGVLSLPQFSGFTDVSPVLLSLPISAAMLIIPHTFFKKG